MNQLNDPKIIVALDYDNEKEALSLVDNLDPTMCRLKVGKEMFTHFGPQFVKKIQDKNFDVFLDMKYHDIPNTVAKAVAAAAELGVWMVNVHASGGPKMMEAAVKELERFGDKKPYLIAVTVLTSMDEAQLKAIGVERTIKEQVLALATLTKNSGLDGVVCSAQEASMLRTSLGNEFKLITPGIRPKSADIGDQVRVVTPKDAIELGSSYLVIGRPITKAKDPIAALKAITAEINS